jgi:hypothetical protein
MRLLTAGRVMLLVALPACRAAGSGGESTKKPATVTSAEFKRLDWIQGGWVGKEPDGNPFYEEYRFKDDSTIGSWSYADSASTVPNDSGEIRLRRGQVTSGNDLVAWVATSLDGKEIKFAPLRGARNSFSWTRGSGGGWVASLHWPADGSRPAKEIVYHMEQRVR